MYFKNLFLNLIVLRFVSYALLTVVLCEFMRLDAVTCPAGAKFSELSYTEFAQTTILVLLAGLFFFLYLGDGRYGAVSFVLGCIMMASFFREEDFYLDKYLYHGSWKLFSGPFLIAAAYHLAVKWSQFLASLTKFSGSYVCGLMIFSTVTLFVFSRLLGRKIFWYAVMGEAYMPDVKNAAEESLELYGYLLLLISGIEYAVFVYREGMQRPSRMRLVPLAPMLKNLRYDILSFFSLLILRKEFKKRKRGDGLWF